MSTRVQNLLMLNPEITGIMDESTPEGSLFGDAVEPAAVAVTTEQTPPASPTEAQAGDSTIQTADTSSVDAPVEPFSFAGREWTSREQAENDFRSWEGRIQAEQATVRDYEKRLNEYWDYVQAVTRENEELQAQEEAYLQAPDEVNAPRADAPKIDFDQIGRLMEIARNQGMDPMAIGMKAYAAQAEKVYEDRLEARIAAVESPIIEMQNASVEQTADREMFLWAQSVRDENGQPAFPELQKGSLNEDLVVNVHRVWKQLAREFGPQYAYSAPGFDYAYRLAYDLTPRQDQGGPSQGQDSGRPRDDQGRFLPAQSAASAASDITGNQPNPSRSRAPKSSMQEMLEELTAIQPVKIGTTDLGFYE